MKAIYVVLHYKDNDLTRRAIQSIPVAVDGIDEIIVVDASWDLDIATTINMHVRRIQTPVYNPGFARAMNVAFRQTQDEAQDLIYVFVNNDAELRPTFRSRVIEIFETDERIAAVGPKIVYYECPERIWSAGGDISSRKMTFSSEYSNRASESVSGTFDTGFLSGCVVAIRGSTLLKLDGWPEAYLFGGEDLEISRRIARQNKRLVINADEIVLHHADPVEWHGKSHTFDRLDFIVNGYMNRILFAKRNFSRAQQIYFRLRLWFFIVIIMPRRWKKLGNFHTNIDKQIVAWRMAKFLFTWDDNRIESFEYLSDVANRLALTAGER